MPVMLTSEKMKRLKMNHSSLISNTSDALLRVLMLFNRA